MLREATRVGWLVAGLALLGALVAGCGATGPTLPSPDAVVQGSTGVTPVIPGTGTPIIGAKQSDFTVCEELSGGDGDDAGFTGAG